MRTFPVRIWSPSDRPHRQVVLVCAILNIERVIQAVVVAIFKKASDWNGAAQVMSAAEKEKDRDSNEI